MVEIPGVAPFRTPAKINVTNTDIRTVIGHLKACGIEEYEIVATTEKGERQVYKKEDFELLTKEVKTTTFNYEEQIDKRFNKLEKLEVITQNILDEATVRELFYTKTPNQIIRDDNIEELEDAFIPEVDISDMKMVSSGVQIFKQDDNEIENAADMLSNLTGKNRR